MSAREDDAIDIPQVVNLSNVNAQDVHAELVRASQSVIGHLEAEETDLNGILVGTVTTGKLSGRRVIVGAIQANQAEVHQGLVGGVRGASLSVSGKTALVIGNSVRAEQVKSGVTAGAQVEAEQIHTGVLIGRTINGNVQTLVDGRTALFAGVLGGLIAGLVLLAGRSLFRRK